MNPKSDPFANLQSDNIGAAPDSPPAGHARATIEARGTMTHGWPGTRPAALSGDRAFNMGKGGGFSPSFPC